MTPSNPDLLDSSLNPIQHPDELEKNPDNRCLWIGNLDKKLIVFHFLKLIQPFGPIHSFDYTVHTKGPLQGQMRGYAFVTYKSMAGAQSCLENLNGKSVNGRQVTVRRAFSFQEKKEKDDKLLRHRLPVLGLTPKMVQDVGREDEDDLSLNKQRMISAIEEKLKAMEEEKNRINFNLTKTQRIVQNRNNLETTQIPPPDSNLIKEENLTNSTLIKNHHYFNRYSRVQWRPYLLRVGRRHFGQKS